MIERQEWQEKIAAAEATLAMEDSEAIAMMRQHEGPALDFCRRALAIARVLLHDTRGAVPHSGWPVIAVSLFIHMLSILRAALTLAVSGHGRELPIVIRPALEALITMLFIAERDQVLRSKRWLAHTAISKQALVRKHADFFEGPEHKAVRRWIEEHANEIADSFPGRFWASGLGCADLRIMADQVGLLWYYDAIYWAGSQPTHSTAIAVEEVITISEETGGPVYRVGLSAIRVHQNLAAYCDFLIRGLGKLNDLFALGIGEALLDLTNEYQSMFSRVLDQEGPR